MEAVKATLGFVMLSLCFVGYFMSIYNQFTYEHTIDFTQILLPLLLVGVWLYVKIEQIIKRQE